MTGMMADMAVGQALHPPDVGRKFSAEGQVLPFLGDTIICHLPQQGQDSEAFDALLDIYRELPGERWSRKVTTLPPSSYHMTIFGGANDKERLTQLWPSGLPLDLPIDECNRILADRLRGFHLGNDAPPYRMQVDLAAPPANETPLTIRLVAADADTETRIRRLRDRLSELLGIDDPGHATYHFHITLAYQVAPMTAAEDAAWRLALSRWKTAVVNRAPVITLGAPEYCVLKDMFAFKRQFYLS